jgi:hypothetical protein
MTAYRFLATLLAAAVAEALVELFTLVRAGRMA